MKKLIILLLLISLVIPIKSIAQSPLQPNESGNIMIISYHNIDTPENKYTTSPEKLKKDLLFLFNNHYRPLSINDYVNNNITTPKGYSPFVLTFDDCARNNFNFLPLNIIDRKSAIPVLIDLQNENKDLATNATFYAIGKYPFDQKCLVKKKVEIMLKNNINIGNHTATHPNISAYTPEQIQREIGQENINLKSFVGKNPHKQFSFAIPGSVDLNNKDYYQYLMNGSYDGVKYSNLCVVGGGWYPAPSPYSPRFTKNPISRISGPSKVHDRLLFYDYHDEFLATPHLRFVSDGDPKSYSGPVITP